MTVGLDKIPGIGDLEKCYDAILQARVSKDHSLSLDRFSLFCQWTRFDPRLAEICVQYISESWKKINPIELYQAFEKQPWPNVVGVLLEFSEKLVFLESPEESDLFQLWKQLITKRLKKSNWEQFFIGQRRIAGQMMLDDARFSLAEYQKWGYLSREILLNKKIENTHSYSLQTRQQILKALVESSPRITTDAYWNALGQSISRRQAERDLRSCSLLKSIGETKGRYFVRKSSRSRS